MPINLRLRSAQGTFTLKLDDDATLSALQEEISTQAKVPITEQELRIGFPPKPIENASPDSKLKDLGIKSGESINLSSKEPSSSLSSSPSPPPPKQVPPFRAQPLSKSSSSTSSSGITGGKRASPPVSNESNKRTKFEEKAGGKGKNIASSVPVEGGHLVLRVVPDDNSCLFSALGIILANGAADAPKRLRQVVVDHIKEDPFTYSEAMLGQSPESYIKAISSPQTWGGAIELSIISKHYRVRLATLDVGTGTLITFGEDEPTFQEIGILVYSGIHYDAVTLSPIPPPSTPPKPTYPPEDMGFDTTQFSLGDFEIFYLPRLQSQMLSDLRSKRYWTDTSTFSLKCERCGIGLVGEKEARQHAKETGHTDFGEYE
ncbi:OTU-domain-containing protein [Atractiella rhizophila]|nr:OTU-domain-containing protein [Atractiella rhizophila]